MQLGEVYYISNKIGDSTQGHYYFIISREASDGLYVAVNCTSFRPELYDEKDCCILEPGEYVGIKHRSLISFHNTRLLNDSKLQKLMGDGFYVVRERASASPTLIGKIQKAFEVSGDVPLNLRKYGFFFRSKI